MAKRSSDRPVCPTCGHRRAGSPRGSAHPSAKMTEDLVREMRAKYRAGGETYLSLAEEYDLAYSTTGAILSGKTWTHVNEEE